MSVFGKLFSKGQDGAKTPITGQLYATDAEGNDVPVMIEAEGIEGHIQAAAPPAKPVVQAVDPHVAQLREELRQEREARQAEKTAAAVASHRLAAKASADEAVKANKILPAGQGHLADLHAFASLNAAGLPTQGIDPAASLASFVAALTQHNLTASVGGGGKLPAGLSVLAGDDKGDPDGEYATSVNNRLYGNRATA